MIIVADPSDLPRITNLAIRELVALRLQQLHSPDELDGEPVGLVVVEAGDSVLALEKAAGFPILTSLDDLPFDHPDFTPPFEILEEHHHEQYRLYELFIVASDSGAGTAIFVADEAEVDANLLAVCRSWATLAVNTP
jgi:hypothetical protein